MLKLGEANLSLFSTSVGFAAAGLSGWLALRWFIPLVERGKLHVLRLTFGAGVGNLVLDVVNEIAKQLEVS